MSWTQMASSRILPIVSGFAVASERWWVTGPCKVCSLFQTSWICVISLSWSNTCYFTHMCHCPTHTLWSSRLQPIHPSNLLAAVLSTLARRSCQGCEMMWGWVPTWKAAYLWTFESVLIGIILSSRGRQNHEKSRLYLKTMSFRVMNKCNVKTWFLEIPILERLTSGMCCCPFWIL